VLHPARKPRTRLVVVAKRKQEESLVSQLSAPLKNFVQDFRMHGKTVWETSAARKLVMASPLAPLVLQSGRSQIHSRKPEAPWRSAA
jgi:hypothetical protein